MKEICYEQIIAGLLLKFESIDNVDFSLIIEDFEEKTGVKVRGLWYVVDNIGKYTNCEKDGTISLKDCTTLDYFIEDENQTLREKFEHAAGNTVMEYFASLDVEIYREEKEKTLKDNKEKVLNEANVLLISDIQDDYDELINYGFKNVDHFKSIIRADAYFAKHPEELERYHIIIRGNQNVQHCCFGGNVELDRRIDRLRDKKHILALPLDRYDYSDHTEFVTYLSDRKNYRSWDTKVPTYKDIFDKIVENMLINHTLEKVGLKDTNFSPIQDIINPNRLPLPTKKSDLKILYLDPIRVSEFADEIARTLGLSITFKEDNNSSLGKYVKSNLGEYDIIIVSRIYSNNILGMNRESTEQCKDTGRELTLLVSQDEFYCGVYDGLADKGKIAYTFGGNLAPSYEIQSKEVWILRRPTGVKVDDEHLKKYTSGEYSQIKGIIEASVNLYNQALIQKGKTAISDLNFRTYEELNEEYRKARETLEAIKEAELAPIRLFDSIRWSILSYLDYRKKGLTYENPRDLKISEGQDGIRVENIYQGRTACAIVFKKEYKNENLRIFEIQTLTKKGTLSSPQRAGLYTSELMDLESVPPRLDEKQSTALVALEKKVNVTLRPLIDEARKRQFEQVTKDSQQTKILNFKKKNNKKQN